MEQLQVLLAKYGNAMGTTFKEMSPKEREQAKVDSLNSAEGYEHERDGFHCAACKNRGYIAKLLELPDGSYTYTTRDCKCAEVRRSILRMKKSGLKDTIKDYTFDKYEVTEPWQRVLKDAAVKYAHEPEGWFFLGGQSGAGKTHLCTAICREFLLGGKRVIYMLWRDDIAKIKALALDAEERFKLVERFKRAEVLYIDDLFKMGRGADGNEQRPTGADINVAFEILNYRYCNRDLLTIISSEWTEDELLDIDEATGGRILERACSLSIGKDRSRNYRTRKAVKV